MLRTLQNKAEVLRASHEILACVRSLSPCHLFRYDRRTITTVRSLDSWDIARFREQAFVPQTPITLPAQESTCPIAIKKWFIHSPDPSDTRSIDRPTTPMLKESFWSRYSDLMVPLEITHAAAEGSEETDFDRIDGPLGLLFADLRATNDGASIPKQSVYLAQHDLRDLPQDLQNDLLLPELVRKTGKGDLYSSSLWMGRSPTYTPLHRDPNPNLLMQLAGTKSVRLFEPEFGQAIFEYVQQLINHQGDEASSSTPRLGSASFRGEEMMKGAERRILHDLVWAEPSNSLNNATILEHAQNAKLHCGQALFIPKGWWHSVKGVGYGLTASANWWFR